MLIARNPDGAKTVAKLLNVTTSSAWLAMDLALGAFDQPDVETAESVLRAELVRMTLVPLGFIFTKLGKSVVIVEEIDSRRDPHLRVTVI